jgi:phosphate transport system substrate-binding protein
MISQHISRRNSSAKRFPMHHRAFTRFLAGCLAAVTLLIPSAMAAPDKLEIVGTGDGIDLLRALGNAYSEQDKQVRIDIPPSIGSGGGIAAVGSGKAVLGRVARNLSDAEIAMGIVYRPIARLPSALVANPNNGVTSLTSRQLRDIYSGQVTNWKELGGADLRIRVVRREDTDSTLLVLRESMPGWKDMTITEKSKTATTTQEAVETVREVPGAIGFAPFSKMLEHGTTVLKIDGHHPTEAQYPSSAVLALIYTDKTVTPEARAFVRFVGTPKAREIVTSFGNIPVN